MVGAVLSSIHHRVAGQPHVAASNSFPSRSGGADWTHERGIGKLIVGGLVLLVLVVVGAWVLLRLGNDTGVEDFRHEVTLSQGEAGRDINAIAHELVDRWLRYFTAPPVGWAARLRDYRIDRVDVTPTEDRFIVSVTFQVKPTRWSVDNWLAGSGGTVEDGWIRGKFTRFALTETEGGFRLRQVGPGPT
jgi:hypothetical protein